MSNYERTLVGGVVVASILPYTNLLPQFVSYAIVLTLYGCLLCYAVMTIDQLRVHRFAFIALLILWLMYTVHLVRAALAGTVPIAMLVRSPSFVLFSFAGVFVVPQLVKIQDLYAIVSWTGAVVTLIGLPTAVLGKYSVLGLTVSAWRPQISLPVVDAELWAISSVFSNPNPFGFLVTVATLAALWEVKRRRTAVGVALLGLNLTGVWLSNSRKALLGIAIGSTIVLAWSILDKKTFDRLVLSGGVGVIIGLLALTGVLPGGSLVDSIDLTGRRKLWEQAVMAMRQRPLFGFGPGDTGEIIRGATGAGGNPHNSYLRMLVTTGVVGATAYVAFVALIVIQSWRNVDSLSSVTLFALLITISIDQFFAAYSLFGLSFTSIVASILFGYGCHLAPAESGSEADTIPSVGSEAGSATN